MKRIGVLLFPDFELLDVFGPLEMFGMLPDEFSIQMLAEKPGLVASIAGPRVTPDATLGKAAAYDILLVPGGQGTRREVANAPLLAWLAKAEPAAEIVASVCTGAALLAKAGLLDGRRATTNKSAFRWVETQGPAVRWQAQARWVEDGKFFTSSGVSAGMDMSLGLIARLLGVERAEQAALWAEYEWQRDPSRDPFAKLNGLA